MLFYFSTFNISILPTENLDFASAPLARGYILGDFSSIFPSSVTYGRKNGNRELYISSDLLIKPDFVNPTYWFVSRFMPKPPTNTAQRNCRDNVGIPTMNSVRVTFGDAE